MKLYFDGSCGPKNPGGYACYAFVIDDKIQKNGVAFEGENATNNTAEFSGLIKGLEYLVENNIFEKLEIFGDSKLVINQLNGEWKCKQEHLKILLNKVKFLLESFESWEATWIPREENYLADSLSKWNLVING